MKSRTKLVLALAAAFGLGGAVVEGLHDQAKAKPAIYAVTEINVKNMDAYMKDYAPKAQALIKKSGGRLVAASSSPTKIEGTAIRRNSRKFARSATSTPISAPSP